MAGEAVQAVQAMRDCTLSDVLDAGHRAKVLKYRGLSLATKGVDVKGEAPLVVVGLQPSKTVHQSSDGALFPWPKNGSGYRLWRLSGWTIHEWMELVQRVNTRDFFGENWNSLSQCARDKTRIYSLERRDTVFVGRMTSLYYEWPQGDIPDAFCPAITKRDAVWRWIPHTSGLSRYWNDKDVRDKCRQMFSEIMHGIQEDRMGGQWSSQ